MPQLCSDQAMQGLSCLVTDLTPVPVIRAESWDCSACRREGLGGSCEVVEIPEGYFYFFFLGEIYLYEGLQTETCKESRLVSKAIHYQADGRHVYRSTLTFFHEAG